MGFQEPAPRPAHRRQGLAPAWWVAALIVAVVAWVWFDQRREADAGAAESDPLVGSSDKIVGSSSEPSSGYSPGDDEGEQIMKLEQRLRQAQRQLSDQREEIDSLDRQLQEARADAELHKRGLERAVAELNRINEDLDKLEEAARAMPRPSIPPAPVDRVRPLGAPFVTTTLNGYVVASGLVHNPTRFSARGTLEVSLVGSGGVIDTRGFLMSVGPGETERYDVTFTNIFPTESLGARAAWVE